MNELMTKIRNGHGTGEWADTNRNCIIGCANDCAYCYARKNAVSNRIIASRAAWPIEVLDETEFKRRQYKTDKLIMFPTRHDTTPANIKYILPYLTGLLETGNNVLFVSKASLVCMKLLCKELENYKDQLMIRVTIGSITPGFCKFWERNAPSPQERLLALQHAKDAGFETSVSMEPMLYGADNAVTTFRAVEPYVTEKIWIGPMNKIDERVDTVNENFRKAVEDIKKLQSKDELQRLYDSLKNEPKVAWKKDLLTAIGLA